MIAPTLHCPCADRHRAPAFAYDAPPEGETRFDLGDVAYARSYESCSLCGHWFARHTLDLTQLYRRDYVDATYGGAEGMRARLQRILELPPARSDNAGRVARIQAFAAARLPTGSRRLLDVGAGIGVFPAAMKQLGWDVTALEPDQRTAQHLREVVGVRADTRDLAALDPGAGRFDAITFNKVLEHVEDPVRLLAAAPRLLAPGGFVYIELPDVAAAADGKAREEFFIEHHHVFSPASAALLAERAGLAVLSVERMREPSGKYTLCGFLGAADCAAGPQ
jgi:2-polyprenyl-3-methyl-5-hydroxy-6-metoxy-1,4-benzoquinol methylase